MAHDLEEAIATLRTWASEKRWGEVTLKFTEGRIAVIAEATTRIPGKGADRG